MKSPLLLLLLLAVFSFSCAQQQARMDSVPTKDNDKAILADSDVAGKVPATEARSFSDNHATQQEVSLSQADQSQLINEAVDRKIVRNAAAEDYRWSSIVLGIIESPGFLMRARASGTPAARRE